MNDILQIEMAVTSFTLMMLGIAAAVALFMGTVGVYGVISYVVSQRTQEIGLRIAFGAGRRSITWMVLGQGLILAGAGVVLGFASAHAFIRLMSALIYGVSPTDSMTYVSVAVVLTAVALLASYLPARRAASVDPMEVLRVE
jgi:ABC-type antimicrobial peptide transport system permease subunit